MPEIPAGVEAGLFSGLTRLFRVPAEVGEDAVAREASAFARQAPSPRAGRPSFPRGAHAELLDAVAAGRDTSQLTRRALAEAGPEGDRALYILDACEAKVEYSRGGGSFYDPPSNTVHIDLDNGHPAVHLVHDATHVEWHHTGASANPANMGRSDYADAMLGEETEAMTRQIYAHMHLQEHSPHLNLPDTTAQQEFMTGYFLAADREDLLAQVRGEALTPDERAIAGDAGGRQAIYDELQSGRITGSATGTPYTQYYGEKWDDRHAG